MRQKYQIALRFMRPEAHRGTRWKRFQSRIDVARGRILLICLSTVAMSCSLTLEKLWIPASARETVDGALTSPQSQIISIEFGTTSPSHRDFWTSCRLLMVPHISRYSSLSPRRASPHPALLTHSFRNLQKFTHRGPSLMWFSSIM